VFEVFSEGRLVASTVLDRRVEGDQWHEIAEVSLSP